MTEEASASESPSAAAAAAIAAAVAGETAPTLGEAEPGAASTVRAPVGWLGPALLERGAEIGRYVVLARLGSGGMGVVYAAYDPELDRKVALKLLKAGTEDAGSRARLLREAQAMAKLSHPNVIAVHDVGTVDEQVFIAMEFVQGMTLARWLWRRGRAWEEIVELFLAVGRGLAAAHGAGLVHRDLKPENVMVGDDGRVRVMDFGLARVDGAVLAEALRDSSIQPREPALGLELTRTGAMIGTPMYMAPEQWEGGETDARTDQFAFCVVLWEALYGERPFGGTTVPALRHAVSNGIIAAPHDPTRAPPWLRRALERGMTLVPDERWPSMTALLAELGRVRGSPTPRTWAVGAAGIVVVAAVAAGLAGLALRGRPAVGVELAGIERRVVGELVAQAHESGARGHWVYGGADDPPDTSFVRLRILEGLGGPIARDEARELRRRLFRSLAELGDHYWDKPGGRGFAAEFYAQACLFAFARGEVLVIEDADRAATALGRAGLAKEALARLRAEAEEGTFSPVEIEGAEELAALAEPASLEAEVPAPVLPPCPPGTVLVEGGELRGRAIDPLCVDLSEVTVAAYQRCVDRGACTPGDTHDLSEHCNLGAPGGGRLPVNCVDWGQARGYCATLGRRLPSEQEWEWAARGGDAARAYPWGQGPATCGLAVMRSGGERGGDGCGRDRAARVGSRPAGNSIHGLKDMVGNVWEWTASGEGGRRVLRGGGWMEGADEKLRVSARISFMPSYRSLGFGFRCVRAPRAGGREGAAGDAPSE